MSNWLMLALVAVHAAGAWYMRNYANLFAFRAYMFVASLLVAACLIVLGAMGRG